MQADRDTFGPRLRLERERRGIALKDIAESTKIKESLFAELERGDFSKWPQGIFRRAHLCAYVSAIGLPSQTILAEFLQLFPEEKPADLPTQLKPTEATEGRKPGKVVTPAPLALRLADRAWVVVFDLAAICGLASIVAGIAGVNLWSALALVGLGYSALGSACFAQSVGGHVQQRIRARVRRRSSPQPTPVSVPLPEVRLIASRPERSSSMRLELDEEHEVHQRRASA